MPYVSTALSLHALAAVLWVGGMAFAWGILRPVAAEVLEGPARQRLWRGVFARFFPLVWAVIVVLLATGYFLLFGVFGGFAGSGMHIHLMHLLGLLMTGVFCYLFFRPWQRFQRAVAQEDWGAGAKDLAAIRSTVAFNLALGLITVAVGAGGRFWL